MKTFLKVYLQLFLLELQNYFDENLSCINNMCFLLLFKNFFLIKKRNLLDHKLPLTLIIELNFCSK